MEKQLLKIDEKELHQLRIELIDIIYDVKGAMDRLEKIYERLKSSQS